MNINARGSFVQTANHYQKQPSLQKSMQRQIEDAANRPSTSKTPELLSLLALQSRDFQPAPGSKVVLKNSGLLGGGDPDKAKRFGEWGSQKLEDTYSKWTTRRQQYEREKTTRKPFEKRLPEHLRGSDASSSRSNTSKRHDLSSTHYQDEDGFWVKKPD